MVIELLSIKLYGSVIFLRLMEFYLIFNNFMEFEVFLLLMLNICFILEMIFCIMFKNIYYDR